MKGKKVRGVVCSGKLLLLLKTCSRSFSDAAVHKRVRSPLRIEKKSVLIPLGMVPSFIGVNIISVLSGSD